MTVAVDLMLLQITPELAPRVEGHLRACKLPAGWLQLDIPERLLLSASDVEPVLIQLRKAGVQLAVDDFGSAGASLATLKNLSLDALNIDCAFVRGLEAEGGSDMAAAIIHLGRALGMRVLAQCVEDERQLDILNSLGCDQFQGSLFSRHLPATGMLELITGQKNAPSLTNRVHPGPVSPSPKKRGIRS